MMKKWMAWGAVAAATTIAGGAAAGDHQDGNDTVGSELADVGGLYAWSAGQQSAADLDHASVRKRHHQLFGSVPIRFSRRQPPPCRS